MLDLQRSAPPSREGALHIVFRMGKLVMDLRSRRPCVISDRDLAVYGWRVLREQFVGYWAGEAVFAVELEDIVEVDEQRFQVGSLYHLVGRVDDGLFSLAGRAAQLLDWQRDHRFCGRCAAPMGAADNGRAMACTACGSQLYPRIAPCVIVLVTRGSELLLARNARFARPMYSTLAGFIEPGESAEDTLRREVQEEVGVEVGELRYFASQSWPFPNQLMLGFFAEYAGGELRPDGEEISEALWCCPDQLPPIPPPASIAGQLIRHHSAAHANTR
ncbi:MAG: NAD(+) diphosphatase [Halieaceae bacterium]|jgi:NAD+ diphosphatase|nr:NAD(+) diphosphatase [Halieaceae bacterium]